MIRTLRSKKGMEMVQVAILIALAVAIGRSSRRRSRNLSTIPLRDLNG